MGVGINVSTNNLENIHAEYEENGGPAGHQLSRTFYRLMCRQHVLSGAPELDQIGALAEIDITPFYDMEQYGQQDEEIQDNIGQVYTLVTSLIDALSQVNNLAAHFEYEPEDTPWEEAEYFLNFTSDKAVNVLDQNFGQDLRNLKRFLEFAREKGTTTVFFHYE